ncbi:MAG TPA: hypothetical protein VFX49_09285, partial [Chloroflexota bacterium]|nr:hypothetical protein [Chloroflexota bacterium]
MPTPWTALTGPNEAYLLDEYERYRRDPNSVHAETRAFFAQAGPPPSGGELPATRTGPPGADGQASLVAAVGELATAIREYGHRAARLDPLGTEPA